MTQHERRYSPRRRQDSKEQDLRLMLVQIQTSQDSFLDRQEDLLARMGRFEDTMSCDVNREKLRVLEKITYGLITGVCALTLVVFTATFNDMKKAQAKVTPSAVAKTGVNNGE